jgi:hypothetical protein
MLLEERDDRLAALVRRPERRYRPGGVLGQKLHEPVDVTALDCAHVVGDELACAIVAQRAQSRLLALLRNGLRGSVPGALRRAVHGRDGCVEELSDLSRGEVEHVAQKEYRVLTGRQMAEASRRTRARSSRAARSASPARSRRPRPRAIRPYTARSTPTPKAARPAACAESPQARDPMTAAVWAGARRAAGSSWSRSCTATSGPSFEPRSL